MVVPFQPVQIHEVIPHFSIGFLELLEQRGAELAEITDNGCALMGIQLLQRVVTFCVKALLDDVLFYTNEIGYGCDEFLCIDSHGIASLLALIETENIPISDKTTLNVSCGFYLLVFFLTSYS